MSYTTARKNNSDSVIQALIRERNRRWQAQNSGNLIGLEKKKELNFCASYRRSPPPPYLGGKHSVTWLNFERKLILQHSRVIKKATVDNNWITVYYYIIKSTLYRLFPKIFTFSTTLFHQAIIDVMVLYYCVTKCTNHCDVIGHHSNRKVIHLISNGYIAETAKSDLEVYIKLPSKLRKEKPSWSGFNGILNFPRAKENLNLLQRISF